VHAARTCDSRDNDHRTQSRIHLTEGYTTPTSALLLPIMPVGRPCNVYREQLIPLDHGHALWEPNPVEGFYDRVTIGDVGYVMDGFFHRMFNVTLSWDDPSNHRHGVPPQCYEPLDIGPLPNVRKAILTRGYYLSRNVHSRANLHDPSTMTSNECVTALSWIDRVH